MKSTLQSIQVLQKMQKAYLSKLTPHLLMSDKQVRHYTTYVSCLFEHVVHLSKEQNKNRYCLQCSHLVLWWSHDVCAANHCHFCSNGERNGHKGEQKYTVSVGITMIQSLQQLQLTKWHITVRSNIELWRNLAYIPCCYQVMLVWKQS